MTDSPPVQRFYCTTHHAPETVPASAVCLHVGPFATTEEALDWASGVAKYQTPPVEPAPIEPERRVITQDELDEAIRITQAMPMPEFWAAAARVGLKRPGYFRHVRWGDRR